VKADATEIYYRLPINTEFVAIAMRDESPGRVFFIDLLTGGVFSLSEPNDGDWEQAGEGFDHDIACGFRHAIHRFLSIGRISGREKRRIIEEFAATLGDQTLAGRLRQAALGERPFASVCDSLEGRPAEICAWRVYIESTCAAAAAEFLREYEISNEPAQALDDVKDAEPAFLIGSRPDKLCLEGALASAPELIKPNARPAR
jgi:hypothetical protein